MRTFALALILSIAASLAPQTAEAATTTWRARKLTREDRQRVLFESCDRGDVSNKERCIARQKKKISRRSARTQPYSAQGLYQKLDRGQERLRRNLRAKMRSSSRIEARRERRSWGNTPRNYPDGNSSELNLRRVRQLRCMQESNTRRRTQCLDKTANSRRHTLRSVRTGM